MNEFHGIVVGLGGEDDDRQELDWAAREAQLRNVPLRVIRTFHLAEGTQPWITSTDRAILADLRRSSERRLATALDHLRRSWPDLVVQCAAVDATAVRELVRTSADALLTVVGSRQQGPIASAAFGSVSTAVAAAACGPVVVVGRRRVERVDRPGVFAGVAGSDTDEVLGFAFDYADRRHRALHVVHCLQPDATRGSRWADADPPELWLADALAGWREKYPQVEVRGDILEQHPVAALATVAAGHDLLVVGSRSRHPRIAAMLGSVSQRVLRHARCPVAVLHPAPRRDLYGA